MKESVLGRTYKNGEIICREKDEGNCMFVVQSGTVEVSKDLPEGEMVLRTMTKGEIFGEIAVFDPMSRLATVKAKGEAVVLRIDKKDFFAKARRDPSLAFNIFKGISNITKDLTREVSENKKTESLSNDNRGLQF